MIDTPILAPIVEKTINENFWPTFTPYLEYAIKETIPSLFANKILLIIIISFFGYISAKKILNITNFINNIHN